jgi:hypothetical protein
MNPYRYAKALAWSGMIMLVGTIIFWGILGQNIPPYSPALGAEEFAAQIIKHAAEIRIGMIVQMPISVLYFTWGVAIWVVMRAIEKENGSNAILSLLQLGGAVFTTVVFVVPCSVWLAVAYRPEVMDPKTLMMMYDFGWMFFDMAYSLTTMQLVAFGICVLQDRREQPLIPVWAAWFTMFVVVSFILLTMMPLVYHGPFSRSGLLNYFVEFTLFFLMWLVVGIFVIKAIGRLEREHLTAHAAR